jgi:hypothetical protein
MGVAKAPDDVAEQRTPAVVDSDNELENDNEPDTDVRPDELLWEADPADGASGQ